MFIKVASYNYVQQISSNNPVVTGGFVFTQSTNRFFVIKFAINCRKNCYSQ